MAYLKQVKYNRGREGGTNNLKLNQGVRFNGVCTATGTFTLFVQI